MCARRARGAYADLFVVVEHRHHGRGGAAGLPCGGGARAVAALLDIPRCVSWIDAPSPTILHMCAPPGCPPAALPSAARRFHRCVFVLDSELPARCGNNACVRKQRLRAEAELPARRDQRRRNARGQNREGVIFQARREAAAVPRWPSAAGTGKDAPEAAPVRAPRRHCGPHERGLRLHLLCPPLGDALLREERKSRPGPPDGGPIARGCRAGLS